MRGDNHFWFTFGPMNDEDKYINKSKRERYILLIGLIFALIIAALFVYQHFHPEKNNNKYQPAPVPVGYDNK